MGGSTARRSASVSSINSLNAAPGAYHSNMVNSAAWVSLPSPLRQTRASWKIGPAPATSRRFMANSGLVCSQSGVRAPAVSVRSVRKVAIWTSSPGAGTA